ncbi:hypothetical protein NIES970_18550 [[Synechococcus] sp. NIES-970]|uniref:DUF2470 domain-containing protein n=1 Tax=Picosynechococcus sp. NKBG15041c TaxID=1407650 RepID=UPI00041698A7|nr:DUF2470 domain-containing protein [Picosynechococcus sp. NKBG15041c]BAW96912.1 hypothetical protein NIES970_18550 [[Synechococcus] sp. NIES-970]
MSEIITQAVSDRICRHMNKDHGEAVLLYAKHFGHCENAAAAEMLSLDATGMQLEVRTTTGATTAVTIPFPKTLKNAKEAHTVLVEMMQMAQGTATT